MGKDSAVALNLVAGMSPIALTGMAKCLIVKESELWYLSSADAVPWRDLRKETAVL